MSESLEEWLENRGDGPGKMADKVIAQLDCAMSAPREQFAAEYKKLQGMAVLSATLVRYYRKMAEGGA